MSLGCLLVLSVTAQTKGTKAPVAAARQASFATPDKAAAALIDAADKFDQAALLSILGPEGKDLIQTGEPAHDRQRAQAFAARAREKNTVTLDGTRTDRAILSVGPELWPVPMPIVKRGARWSFDSKAGLREVLLRQIGANELDAIAICRGYVEAQHEYALKKREGYDVNQYAQKIISTPGKQDGLAWKNSDGTWGGPVGENIATAIQQGHNSKTEPYHGYYFKVLKGQGPAAPLGQMDFVVKGAMIGGFALIAAPAKYRVTGVKTFMVSHDGVVYEKDLGPNTLEIARKIALFNPDRTWSPVQDK
jgi:hypothetical protein